MNKPDVQRSDLMAAMALATIISRLDSIEGKLEKKVSYWLTEEAVESFREHLKLTHKCPENFECVLNKFEQFFRGKNVADLTPTEVEGFIFSRWGDKENSTIDKRIVQLSAFFNYCINELRRKGSPDFNNPCKLVQKVKVTAPVKSGFTSAEKIKELLGTFTEDKHRLMISILIMAGLRVGELLKLRPRDVNRRILTLIEPKSGRDKEYAVIPEKVATDLALHVKYLDQDKPIFPTNRNVVNKLLSRHAEWVGLEMSTHDLRKWCATFYARNDNMDMVRFTLRHSATKDQSGSVAMSALTSRYVSMLSPAEAMVEQDRLMVNELIEGEAWS